MKKNQQQQSDEVHLRDILQNTWYMTGTPQNCPDHEKQEKIEKLGRLQET